MSNITENFLNIGLAKGFGGASKFEETDRQGFSFDTSDYHEDGNSYHDEWISGRCGAGQEVVKVGDETYTRVYAGGTIPTNELESLGISKGDVMNFLKKNILENSDKIRLHQNFQSEEIDGWQYSYQVLEEIPGIELTLGKESILYQSKVVFVHDFLITPVI